MACTLPNQKKSVRDLKFKLESGNYIPLVGFGTFSIKDVDETRNALDMALAAGFRHFDTAQIYENEEFIGKAFKELLPKYNLSRNDIFITSKIDVGDQNPDGYKSVQESLKLLNMDYIDLYLIHHPAIVCWDMRSGQRKVGGFTKGPKNAEIRDQKWQALVRARKEGLVRDIGVSNYSVKHLKELLANDHGVKPSVNQIYWSPLRQSRDVLELCQKENILVVAYSSFGGGPADRAQLKDHPVINKIAEKLGKSASQVLLRWTLQDGIAIIPKASSKEHIEENIALDFVVPEEDVNMLNNIEQNSSWHDFNIID